MKEGEGKAKLEEGGKDRMGRIGKTKDGREKRE